MKGFRVVTAGCITAKETGNKHGLQVRIRKQTLKYTADTGDFENDLLLCIKSTPRVKITHRGGSRREIEGDGVFHKNQHVFE